MISSLIARILPKKRIRQPRIYHAAQHTIRAGQIDPAALSVIRRLHSSGFQAFVVGGAVRDLLLERRPKDFDIATNATPEQIKPLFRRAFIIGRRFKLVHVHVGRDVIEVSTFRTVQTDENATDEHGRLLSDNVYGTQSEDAMRRDFTVNALYFDPLSEEIWDYVGGVNDIRARRLKLIGSPVTRYREDPVRMLRAVRLAGKLDLTIAPSSEKPLRKLAGLMAHIPPTRLFEETQKLLLSGNAEKNITEVRHYHLLPGLDALLLDENAEHFAALALKHTDDRINIGKTVSPAYLFGALLWPMVTRERDVLLAAGGKPLPALLEAIDTVFERYAHKLAMPRRFQTMIRDIWVSQPRFEQRSGQRPYRLFGQPKFRAAYDFMLMRGENGEVPEELCRWWTLFQDADEEGRQLLIHQLAKTTDDKRSRHRRRRKTAAKLAANGAESS
ncbi:MAG: polynucleotide adenylyltransferase PcnB [Burkholderiales bacterium]|jgi:poly(A) polymerase|nr:polynucleotide adenylyltransferase PcnB [Burkholderiales bacterium]